MRHILWAGGFYSTYLLCKRARENKEEIQPVYFLRNGRGSTSIEQDSQKSILEILRSKTEVIATIHDPVTFEEDNLPKPDGFDEAYARVAETAELNSLQFMSLLGRLSYQFPGIESGIEAPAPGYRKTGRIETFLNDNGVTVNDDGTFSYANANEDVKLIFGSLCFPIIRTDAAGELEAYRQWGWFEDVAKKTRTCMSNLPRSCGVCSTCETKLRYGNTFSYLFDTKSLRDHKVKEYFDNTNHAFSVIFERYVMNGDLLKPCRLGIDSKTIIIDAEKVYEITNYFEKLRKLYPYTGGVNAPEI